MDDQPQNLLSYGERLNALRTQPNHAPVPMPIQVSMPYALTRGLLNVSHDLVIKWKAEYPHFLRSRYSDMLKKLS